MLLRIVHPGGHTELHDRPVTAAEIMRHNRECCVAYPYVFQQPWAIVAPDTVLMLGQKYYVVPMSTIRKIQRLSPRHSPSPAREINISSSLEEIRNTQSSKDKEDDGMISTCCIFRKNAKQSNSCKQHSRNKIKKSEIGPDVRNLNLDVNDKSGGLSYDNCLMCLFTRVTTKANVSDVTKERRTSSSNTELSDSNTLTSKRTQDLTGSEFKGSPKKAWSSEHWQPSLESITEE